MAKDIFEFIKNEEAAYALPIVVIDGWEWSMKEHIRLTTLYKNSQFSVGNTKTERDDKPFKNIVRPILNLQYRTEGFDVKDIVLFVDNNEEYYKSFLVKKYHTRWARDFEIDTFIDELVESKTDYGGALVKNVNKERPEVVPLYTIAFCDQSNMLGGALGLKHFYSPDKLMEFEKVGWGKKENGATADLVDVIVLAQEYKVPDAQTGQQVKTPGKYVETYEVHGVLPESFLKANGKPDKYVRQMHIVCFYKDEKGDKQGLTLYRGREKELPFKQDLRDKIFGRALGFGGVEELFEPQVWTNYGEIRMKNLLDAAAKIIHQTTDDTMKGRNKLNNLDQNEVVVMAEGKTISQVNTQPANFQLFDKKTNEWEEHARVIGAANETALGGQPPSGTPFKLQELITAEAHGLHEYRQGKTATFVGTLYKDWVLPFIKKALSSGTKFLEDLSLDELQQVADSLVMCVTNGVIKEKILNGEEIIPAEIERIKLEVRANFMKKGSKHFLEVFKNEMDDIPVAVEVIIKGKQKDLNKITDKLVNIFRQIIANPAILNDPRMAKLFNEIIEASGLSPLDFGTAMYNPAPPAQGKPIVEELIPKTEQMAVA